MAKSDRLPLLVLESNYGSVGHWTRLVANARELGATRLVWLKFRRGVLMPNLYRWLPEMHAAFDWEKEGILAMREELATCARLTRAAGMEFYLWCPVLHFHPLDRQRLPAVVPQLFAGKLVPDAGAPFFAEFVREQLRETFRDFPDVDGIALWMCENSDYHPLALASVAPLKQVLDTCFDAAYQVCREERRGLVADIHSAAGSAEVSGEMIRTYARYPDVPVQTDATWGDYSLTCPTSVFIPEVVKHNDVIVNFDLYGEYFGRNTVPTIYLNWMKKHVENARAMAGDRLVGVDGRVSTAHDDYWPHYEILPRLVGEFPLAPEDRHHRSNSLDGQPWHAELSCFETLCRAQALALRRIREGETLDPVEVIREMCESEFGAETAAELAELLAAVEPVLVAIYTVHGLYFGGQSVIPGERLLDAHCFFDLFREPGSEFPNPASLHDGKWRAPFDGDWPAPKGTKTISFAEMAAAIGEGVTTAEALLARFQPLKARLRPADAEFLERQFRLLVVTARVRYCLFHGLYYSSLLRKQQGDGKTAGKLGEWTERLAQAVDDAVPLVGSEDGTVVVPARKWVGVFAG